MLCGSRLEVGRPELLCVAGTASKQVVLIFVFFLRLISYVRRSCCIDLVDGPEAWVVRHGPEVVDMCSSTGEQVPILAQFLQLMQTNTGNGFV